MLALALTIAALGQAPPSVPAAQADFPTVVPGDVRPETQPRPITAPESPAAIALSLWRRPDGSWRAPMPESIPTGPWRGVALYRYRCRTGTVWVHPDRVTLLAYCREIDRAVERGRTSAPPANVLLTPANLAVPPPAFAAPAWCPQGST
jgi:hypothetical protein